MPSRRIFFSLIKKAKDNTKRAINERKLANIHDVIGGNHNFDLGAVGSLGVSVFLLPSVLIYSTMLLMLSAVRSG